ncbi:MAG: alpha-glucan family phosphorylase, partial [Deferribacteraceae bacterium]|nr:alpha-glucan family phosphorylase [Deferribacteraceae bacterium]
MDLTGSTLFEVSWEVCNKVGGIYAVVSSKVLEAMENFGDNYYLLGPDLGNSPEFTETNEACWDIIAPALQAQNLHCRFGRWDIPGNPKVILVKFKDRYNESQLLHELWSRYGVDSLTGGWDYVEPVMFSTACGEVIANVCKALNKKETDKSFAHFHEWMCGAGLLYLKTYAPEIATVFTTHATVLGRSMAGSGFDIYRQMKQINPKREAGAYNVTAKCSMETISAQMADCFTTVGKITADESTHFLGRTPDELTLNGLDMRIIDDYSKTRTKPEKNRKAVLDVCGKLMRQKLADNTRIFIISGRYEYHNKGVDIFLEALAQLNDSLSQSNTTVLAICAVLGGHNGVNQDAVSGDNSKQSDQGRNWITSHYLHNQQHDAILNTCRRLGLDNINENNVKFIFTPAMLDGHDGFFNMTYYDLLAASDLGVFPSWYEPWGYTPEESVAHAVPTVTTDLSGFGIWVRDTEGLDVSGAHIVPRRKTTYDDTKLALCKVLKDYALMPDAELSRRRASARGLADMCSWEHFFPNYINAYSFAAAKASERLSIQEEVFVDKRPVVSNAERPVLYGFTAMAELPKELERLKELAYNFWWCWNPACWELFSQLNNEEWEKSYHNPVSTLKNTSDKRFSVIVKDSLYMHLYEDVMEEFDKYMQRPINSYGNLTPAQPVAYFSTEYGLAECLTIYSGGLGVLSGDHLKSASDLAIPLVAIGLLYKNGYFRQQIDKNNRQAAIYPENDFNSLPITLVKDTNGNPVKINLKLPGRTLFAQVWCVNVGCIKLYLMDSDIVDNTVDDRRITARLYEADRDLRLRQEMLLGMGGVRMLDELGIKPSVYHMNEGHSAFLIIERIRQLVQEQGMGFAEAGEYVRGNNVFTTHTPIDAGNEVFTPERMAEYFTMYAQMLGISWHDFMNMGHFEGSERTIFEMTVLALKYAVKANGVSALHGHVARLMWHQGWKRMPHAEVPIGSVTNGIHVPSYAGPAIRTLFYRELGSEWLTAMPNDPLWDKIDDIPNKLLWNAKQSQKAELLEFTKKSITKVLARMPIPHEQHKQILASLVPEALVIGFARRFAPYKRANLLFADIDRITKILSDEKRPVIFIFAGKAHPADGPGGDILQQVVNMSYDPRFLGKVFFIEDYDLSVSRAMVQGCDVWLNNPRRPYEASGTSGQKVPVNGGLNLSVSDGWWVEGYNGENGWTIGPAVDVNEIVHDQSDYNDAMSLYRLLEDHVVPLYFNRMSDGLPHGWLDYVRESIKTLTSQYSSGRMVSDYVREYYTPAAERYMELVADDKELAKSLAAWKSSVGGRFGSVKIEEIAINGIDNDHQMHLDQDISVRVRVSPGEMRPDELLVQLVVGTG